MLGTFKKLDFVIQQTEEITKFYDQSKKNDILIFCMTMLERLRASSESLKILLADPAQYAKVEYGCGIIIRSFILDFLIVLNAADIYGKYNDRLHMKNELKDELNDFCLMMLTDTVKHTIKDIKKMKKYDLISEESVNEAYRNLASLYENCFQKESSLKSEPVLLFKRKIRKNDEIFDSVIKSEKVKDFKDLVPAYLFYSKYDHFGQVSYSVQKTDIQGRINTIENVIDHFPHMVKFVIGVLTPVKVNNSFLLDKIKVVVSFIEQNSLGT
jgi:hypothetical protein